MVVEVAQVVVGIVAALVAAVDMDLAGGCLVVHAQPLYLDNTLALPCLLISRSIC